MFWWVVSALLLLFVAYATRVLFFGLDEEVGTSLSDFIKEAEDVDERDIAARKASALSKYYTTSEDPGKQILILYGTEYGFSEEVARKLFDRIAEGESFQAQSIQPRVVNSKEFQKVDLSKELVLLCVFSTTGDGVPPTDSRPFFDYLSSPDTPASLFPQLNYSVLALGDYNYTHFCRAGKTLDTRLSELGSKCIHPRVDVDLEDWSVIERWMDSVTDALLQLQLPMATDYLELSMPEEDTGVTRTHPFRARMTVKYNLTSSDAPSDKETFHTEFDLTDSEITYTSGDALGIYPLNNPPEVTAMISALHTTWDTQIAVPQSCFSPRPEGESMCLGEGLSKYYDLKTVKLDLVKLLSVSASDSRQRQAGEALLKDGLTKQNAALSSYVSEREVTDVLKDFSSFQCPLGDLLTQLRPLQPRYYSIASSPLSSMESVSICVAVVRYNLLEQPRTGVCTTYLQDRLAVEGSCPVFISQNPDFRLPKDGDAPIVMIGPGTGIAPFRAFMQERVISNAQGSNLLYFGCRHKDKDFLYKDELEKWAALGLLKLRTAFSRDQAKKVYVQHLIAQDKEMLWKMMEEGGHVYVCGDAVSMAGDVHEALLKVMEVEGGRSREEAEQYMDKLEKDGRYQRDVWVT